MSQLKPAAQTCYRAVSVVLCIFGFLSYNQSIASTSAAVPVVKKTRLVIKTPGMPPSLLNHKGLLGSYQRALESQYDVTYTTDPEATADILLLSKFEAPTESYYDYWMTMWRWAQGKHQKSVSLSAICRDPAAVKILYAQETWHSFPKGYDDCFDLIIGFDQMPQHPRYQTISGVAYEWFSDKISTQYNPSKDPWRSAGCQPEQRKYDVCMLVSKRQERTSMDLALDRIALYHAFSHKVTTASGGSVDNNIGYTVPKGDELDWLMNCKFVVGYENTTYPGYITEKPYQAWLAGAIPIYSAHRSVLGKINREAVVYAPDFATHEEIVNHVMHLLENQDAYCSIWQKTLHLDRGLDFEIQQAAVTKRLMQITQDKLMPDH